MPRSVPAPPTIPESEKNHPGKETRTYTIHVVTPIFQGGAIAKRGDDITPIRGFGVRGQLRFWWRATQGAACPTTADLFRREESVWGSAERPSPVQIAITYQNPGNKVALAEWGGKFGNRAFVRSQFPEYALFPLSNPPKDLDKDVKEQIFQGHEGVVFNLKVSCPPSKWGEVKSALWAWANFGGVGGRTRRGCGALYCKDFAPPPDCQSVADFKGWLGKVWQEHIGITPDESTAWPRLSKSNILLFSGRNGSPRLEDTVASWNRAVKSLQDFRQGAGIGRSGHRGRSRWPEAEAIRALTQRRDDDHLTKIDPPHPNAFPRADLGLPILFHFKDERDGDPHDSTLKPRWKGEFKDRMASPIITKPLAISPTRCVAIVLLLDAPALEGVRLEADRGPHDFDHTHVVDPSCATYPNSPLGGRSPQGSAVEAYLKYLTENDFVEVGE